MLASMRLTRLGILVVAMSHASACDYSDPGKGANDASVAPPSDTGLGSEASAPMSGDTSLVDTGSVEATNAPGDPAGDTTAVEATSPPEDVPGEAGEASEATVGDAGTPEGSSPPEDVATDAAETAETAETIILPTTPPPIIETQTTSTGGWTLAPGKEATKCVVQRLGNANELWVSQVRTTLAKGSHHLVVYVSDETEEQTTPFNCTPFVETLRGTTYPIMISQIREETLKFPSGVAFKFAPHQMVRIETHYLNYYADPITASSVIAFDAIEKEDVAAEGNMLFYGNPDFVIPKGGAPYSTPWRWLSVLPGTHVFAVTGHTHQYGTNGEIAQSTSVDDPGMSLYPPAGAPYDWEEPPLTYFDPALGFDPDKGFRYRCTWENTSASDVDFGESANAEMCFLWAYYYPSQGYRICLSPGDIGGGVAGDEVCCPGSWVCDYIKGFL